jgi:uncharacterized protein
MSDWIDPQQSQAEAAARTAGQSSVAVDQGLRSHMLKVYNYMGLGVMLTGVIAMLFASSAIGQQILFSPLRYVLMFAPLAFVLVLSFGAHKMSQGTLQLCFWAFAAVMGLSMSTVFLVFTEASIAQTFFVTAVAFLGLSLVGYTTKKDLSAMGSFLIMGVIGLFVAGLANLYFQSGMFNLVISAIGVLVFAGLTAYDTQRIKSEYFQYAGTPYLGKAAILGALNLYLDFINMFQYLLSFLGSRD